MYLTIVGLLALTGVSYAANPAPLASNQPLASKFNPTVASNVASGGGFQPLQVNANFSWVGGTVAGWNSSGNWSPLGPPGPGDTALFDGPFINQPNLTTGATVGTLHMATGVIQNVSLSANSGAVLNISGLSILGTGILVDNTNAVTLTITASLGVNNNQAWTNNSGNLFTVSAANISLSGNALTVNGTGNALISSIISGIPAGSTITKDGSGILTLTGNNIYTDGTTVPGGTLLVNNTAGSGTGTGAVTVSNAGTTLGGTGTIGGPVIVNTGANIAPGNGGNNTGILTTGALTLASNSNFLVDINGTTPGSEYDQINSNPSGIAGVTITDSNLVVTVGTPLSVGQTFTILIENSAGAITGTFAGIPEGGTVAGSNGDVFSVSYTGGDGNDIVLTVLSAINSSIFVMPGHGVEVPIGLAADPGHLYVSQYFDNQIKMVDCNGNGSLFGTLPAPIPPILTEKYMAIAPAESAAAGFTPGDLFVTLGEKVFKATPPGGIFTQFADWSGVTGGCPFSDQSAIAFDKVGTFGFNMIVTCENGSVFTIDGNTNVTFIANTTDAEHATHIEGPAVLPLNFGPLGGQIMVADDIYNELYTIDNMGNVNHNPFGVPPETFAGAEQILVIPELPCTYCADRAFFQASASFDQITSYPPGDFTGLGGDILVSSEGDPPWGIFRVHFDVPSQSYQFFVFDASSILNEGGTFVEGSCPPSPTPTPTATSTPTSTPTATPTATATATFTPTATATFTPTPTATGTPTATATATPTPTPTPTPAEGDFSWTGATNTIWNTSTNWSPSMGAPPGAVQTARFAGPFTNQPNVTLGRLVGTLHMTDSVAQNVTLSSNAAAVLTITGRGILGTGVLIDNTNAFTLTITARVGLDASQTWTNNSGNLFTVSGTTLGLGENNTLTVNGTGNTLISAFTDGAGSGSTIIKDGGGTLTMTANNAYSGGTIVNGGTLLVNGSGDLGDEAVTVNSGGTLGGNSTKPIINRGVFGNPNTRLTIKAGGNLAPGNGGNNTAVLTVTVLTLEPASNFRIDINGTTPGSGYDRLVVTDSGNDRFVITNSNLVVTVGTTLSVGQTFQIGQRTATQSITGQFLQGSTVIGSDGTAFSIDYGGGDGNDIVLTVVQLPAASSQKDGIHLTENRQN